MEKPQLVNFIAKVLEDSGFKVYKNFKTSQQVVDIYAILQTSMGDFGLVVACKNYDKDWEVGIDVLKEMEVIGNGKKLRASKVAVVTSSGFSSQAKRYAEERKIKLIDRNNLVTLAKKYSNKNKETKSRLDRGASRLTDIDSDSFYNRDVNRDYIDNTSNYNRDYDDDRSYNRLQGAYEGYEEFSEDMEYYEDEVGGLELSHYSEYDDDLYRAEFLNKTPRDNYSGPASTLFANRQQQAPKRRRAPSLSGNRRVGSLSQRSNRPTNNHSFFSSSDNALSNFSGHVPQKPRKPWGEIIKPILSNPIASVAVVVIISYLIGFILGKIVKVPTGYLGIAELVIALILSYGIVLYSDKEADVLVKGSIVFFISLVIIMILIVAF